MILLWCVNWWIQRGFIKHALDSLIEETQVGEGRNSGQSILSPLEGIFLKFSLSTPARPLSHTLPNVLERTSKLTWTFGVFQVRGIKTSPRRKLQGEVSRAKNSKD
jgi:hypothetical protein